MTGNTRDLIPHDWVELDGLRVMSPLRTAMDLGCSLPPHAALGAMDALMRGHRFSHGDMRVLDEARREALRRAGWIVMVVTKSGLSGTQRDAWLTELAEALQSRRVR